MRGGEGWVEVRVAVGRRRRSVEGERVERGSAIQGDDNDSKIMTVRCEVVSVVGGRFMRLTAASDERQRRQGGETHTSQPQLRSTTTT